MSGLCGNFDMVTVNDMTTAGHMEVSNAQAFGDSWAVGQVRHLSQEERDIDTLQKQNSYLLF